MAKKRSAASSVNKRASATESTDPVQTTVVLDSTLNIASAGQLRDQLLPVLTGKQPVVLDAANVERVDTAALQVLTAFMKDAGAQNLDIQWKEPAQALINAAQLLGLCDSLHLNGVN